MSDPSSPSSNRLPAGVPALDGEVLPPKIRTVNPPPPDSPAAAATAAPNAPARLTVGTAALALGLLAALGGAGAVGSYAWIHRAPAVAAQPSPTAVALSRLGKDVAELKSSVEATRQDETVRALKKGVDQLRTELDGLRAANTAAIAQLSGKLDKPAPAAVASPALADVAARLDKLDHDPRLGDITARLDRIERQVSAPTPTGSIASSARAPAAQTVVAQAASTTAKPTARPAVLDNWIVRDVYSGIALVEGRSGSVREVVPGEVLPGAGAVRSIERHGRGWIVVTSRGIIDTETWWGERNGPATTHPPSRAGPAR